MLEQDMLAPIERVSKPSTPTSAGASTPPPTPKKEGVAVQAAALLPAATASLLEKLDAIADKIADAMPGKIGNATLAQAGTALGIVIDKALLLRGKAAPPPAPGAAAKEDEAAEVAADLKPYADVIRELMERESGAAAGDVPADGAAQPLAAAGAHPAPG
jgi:hypothetical protein